MARPKPVPAKATLVKPGHAAPAARPAPAVARPAEAPRAPPALGRDAIVVENLVKTYPNGTQAVRGVSFRVREREFYGILGPNGAGKTTIIGVLGTLVRPTAGHATVLGLDVTKKAHEVRKRIGFAMQEAGVDALATGLEFLVLQGRLQGLPRGEAKRRALELLRLFELEDAAGKRIKNYSGGMKRRIDLASALIHEPPVLFLDEPTEGLDPSSRRTMWETLRRLNRERGTTVILTTHYMEEADALCDRLAIIDQGRIVVEGAPAQLKASVGGQSVRLHYPPGGPAAKALAAVQRAEGIERALAMDGDVVAYVRDAASQAPQLLRLLDKAGAPPQSVSIHAPSLDDVYLRFTGRTIEKAEAAA